ncbi:hypothetical protein AND4_04403 [Vibrio sp. AND4]|nr:hypothetical protein AND4_04403 [Vibrio sp. AND4]
MVIPIVLVALTQSENELFDQLVSQIEVVALGGHCVQHPRFVDMPARLSQQAD